MPRAARQLLDNAVYHLLSHGNNGQLLFHADGDFARYLELAAAVFLRHGIHVYHFALLPDHVHLLVRLGAAWRLSRAMLSLNLAYALYYRHRHGYRGHVWQGRFKSQAVAEESVMEFGRFLELHPLRDGLADHPDRYPWTSYHAHAGAQTLPLIPVAYPAYASLAVTPHERHQKYRAFVEVGLRAYADRLNARPAFGQPGATRRGHPSLVKSYAS